MLSSVSRLVPKLLEVTTIPQKVMCLPGFDHRAKEQVSIGPHTAMPLAKRFSPIPKDIEQNKGEKWGVGCRSQTQL